MKTMSWRRRLPRVALLVLLLAGCHAQPRAREAKPAAPEPRVRLGWVTWNDVNEVIYCNRRVDDYGNAIGVLGPCFRQVAGERAPHKLLSWLNIGRSDEAAPDAFPTPRCTVELVEAKLTPPVAPARALLHAPAGTRVLHEWSPDADGDRFALELSFSPEGKWMAVAHVAIHVGGGERIVEIPAVGIEPVPACI